MNAINKAIMQPFKFFCSNLDLAMVPAVCCNTDAISDTTKKNRFNSVVTADNHLVLLRNVYIRANESISLNTSLFNLKDLDSKNRLSFANTQYYSFPMYWYNNVSGYPQNKYFGELLVSIGSTGNFIVRASKIFDYSTGDVTIHNGYTPPNATSIAVVQTMGKSIDMNSSLYASTYVTS